MNVTSLFHHFVRSGSNDWQALAARREAEQPIRLPPTMEASDLPPEFEDVLEVQVLGYRERVTTFYGHKLHLLDPIWTLVPKDR
jgi:hypothetical protein